MTSLFSSWLTVMLVTQWKRRSEELDCASVWVAAETFEWNNNCPSSSSFFVALILKFSLYWVWIHKWFQFQSFFIFYWREKQEFVRVVNNGGYLRKMSRIWILHEQHFSIGTLDFLFQLASNLPAGLGVGTLQLSPLKQITRFPSSVFPFKDLS